MRISMRYVAPLALAAAVAMAVVGVAMAAPNGNSSSVQGSGFKPTTLPKTTYKAGALFVHTHAHYAHPGQRAAGRVTPIVRSSTSTMTEGSTRPESRGATRR